MLTVKITSKGQVTIPKEIRDKLGIRPGEDIAFEEKNGTFYIRKSLKKSPFDKWVGRLKKYRRQKTDEIIKDLRGT
ncbi:MAG: AbrB/MazE/SpoVT family DNA-binding domain-containing protein [Candidatus Brocadia sp.]|nr:AbrB/MazE/SpoVT family DNA-binding domain-containing protein [Candidatus Brocadia sp.]UJS17327.1 MAG: AbrB/MazE/SpoVT family DNA-binding domain-containing protein [Candidatus Jettenia sp.]